jgi:serine/threonine-protein kinase
MTEPTQLLRSALADRYAIERKVGEGGMATVYLARDLKHDRDVALKVMRAELVAVLGVERFLNEIRVTANLHHPNILPLFDSGEVDGFLYYVMPYIGGQTLRDKLEQERQFSIPEALSITKDILAALDYAHRQGVIHRDVKPDNIVMQDGHALVLDFGIALAVSAAGGERLTGTGLSLGTPSYMSPEQATGDRNVDARSDVYSTACVLFEMLAGDPPYAGSNVPAVVARILTEKPPSVLGRRDSVPVHVAEALDRAFAKVPADRYATAGLFAEALEAPATSVRKPGGRRWTIPAALAALLATIAVVAAVVTFQDASPIPPLTEVVRLTTLPGLEDQPTWAPDGRTLIYTSSEGGHLGLWMRQVDGDRALRVGLEDVDEAQPAYSPDGSQVAFVSARNRGGRLGIFRGPRATEAYLYGQNGDLFVMPALGGNARKLADDAYDPSWSPDGREIAFRSARDGSWRLYTVSVTDGRITRVRGAEPRVAGLDWSPDGRWIAFVAGETDATGWDLYVISTAATDSVARQLTSDSASVALHPAWSPNSDWIAFSSTRGGSLNLWGVPFDAEDTSTPAIPQRLTIGVGEDVGAVVASDGRGVAYANVRTAPDVWVLDSEVGTTTPVTSETTIEEAPRMSPDGQRLLFYSNRTGTDQLWTMDLESGGLDQISREGAHEGSWSPDGRYVAYGGFGTTQGLTVQDVTTGAVRTFVPHLLVSHPAFSPHGQSIAFRGRDGRPSGALYFPVRRSQLYLLSLEDESLRLIPTPEGDSGMPAWSADGGKVYFQLERQGAVTLWDVDIESGQFSRIPTGGDDDAHPAVSPDGRQILFLSCR